MSSARLLQARELHERIRAGECVVFDCRFDLQHTQAGRNSWLAGHVPGAAYAHLDDDLSGPVTPVSGRHPLPWAEDFAAFLARSGWRPGLLAVAYDASGGMLAARLWWLMGYFGAGPCALLDGGLSAWLAESLPIEAGEVEHEPQALERLVVQPEMAVSVEELQAGLDADQFCLLDARSAERFRGEVEPLDTVAGHVPGSLNHPCESNLGPDKRLLPADELRRRFKAFAGRDGQRPVVHLCGSGVTACFNAFAMEHAGFTRNQVYVGSWSEWIRDPGRPVATGEA